jgi:hypothetical protein
MASNGSTSLAVTAYDTLKFSWAQIGQSTADNTTTISWSLQLVAGSAGQIVSSASKAWSVTVDGVRFNGTNSVAIGNNTTKTLASGQVTIAHAADGTKSFAYSFSQEFGITFAGASVGTATGSGSGTLNPIPRATTPGLSASVVDMDTTMIIYTAGAVDTFTHDLAYSFAGGVFISIAKDVTDLAYWKVPLDLARSIPNTTSGTVTIRCTTKNGSETVGTRTVLVTVKVPAGIKPTVDAVTHVEASAGIADAVGAYVQGKSKVKVGITASGAYGSTIKSYSSTLVGKTYTGNSWTSDTINLSGTVSIVTMVTDSRGRTESVTTPLTVLAYTPPQIFAFSVSRCTSAGMADPDGIYVRLRLAYSVSSLNNRNTASAKVEYKRSIDSSWSTLNTWTALSNDLDTAMTGRTFTTDYQYDFRVRLTDAFNSAAPAAYNSVLPSGAVILDIKADGKGVAFFKTSTRDGVEIAGELPGSAIGLTTNADLNDLTSPGFYAIPTATIAGTVKNKPYTDSVTACIEVKKTGEGMLKQIVQKSTKTDGAIYERGYDSNGWGAWSVVYSGSGRMLWTGSRLMTDSETITLSEPVSQQQSGIVLVFSRYVSGTAADYYYSCHFFPKQILTAVSSAGTCFVMTTSKMEAISAKYLKIADTTITGAAENDDSGTMNGVTFNNDRYALRYVIGV